MKPPRLLLVGSGDQAFRGYALEAVSSRALIVLLTNRAITWESELVTAAHQVDFSDYPAVLQACRCADADAILTYDERYVELTARLALDLGLPYTDPDAIRLCKDKSLLRGRLEATGVSPVRFAVATSPETALAQAAEIGYPLVLKPRALGGSAGVVRVDDAAQLLDAFATAAGARVGTTMSAYEGVLLEEYLSGPEFSVDSVTWEGVTTPMVVAEKVVDLPPYFEEVGHYVPADNSLAVSEALEMVRAAHAVAGLDRLVTHTEFRLTPVGPRIIEINVRLGGDLIPYLGRLALGVDLAGCAADLALGMTPVRRPSAPRAAAVRFFYPTVDMRIERVGLRRPSSTYAGLDRFVPLVRPGDVVQLPPRGFLSRVALAVVTGADRAECETRLADVAADLVCEGSPLVTVGAGGMTP